MKTRFFDFSPTSKTFLGGLIALIPTVATMLGYDMTTEVVEGIANQPEQIGDVIEGLGVLLSTLGIRTAIHRSGVGEVP